MASKRKTITTTPKPRRTSKKNDQRKPLAEISKNQDESHVSESKHKDKVVGANNDSNIMKKKAKHDTKKSKDQHYIDEKPNDNVIHSDISQNQDIYVSNLLSKLVSNCV